MLKARPYGLATFPYALLLMIRLFLKFECPTIEIWVNLVSPIKFLAATGQLYKRVCRSVGRLVRPSVRPSVRPLVYPLVRFNFFTFEL